VVELLAVAVVVVVGVAQRQGLKDPLMLQVVQGVVVALVFQAVESLELLLVQILEINKVELAVQVLQQQ
jgi:hypothetical protein